MDMFGIDTMGPDERRELVRRNIQNLITSYADDGDVFTELIQNAIDAINLRQDKEPSVVGDLVIIIGRRSENAHYVYVQDNGLGMSDETATRMFIPAFSSGKKAGATVGHKGVGVSFVVGVSNMLALRTIDGAGAVTERTIRHTHEWVTDSEKPSPTVVAEFDAPPAVKLLADAIERGTGVYFEFHAGHEPTSLDNIVRIGDGPQKEIDHWAAFLCARTPLGLARPIGTPAPDPALAVQIFLDLGDGNPLNKMYHRSDFDLGATPPTLGYPFPEAVFKVGMDTEKIDATPPAQLRNHDRKYPAVYREWTGDELDEFLEGLDDEYRELLAVHLDWVRGYFAYSTDVLGEIRQIMGTQRRVVRYGARLVVDSVPQGHPVDLALTSNQGLERQTHIVVGLKNVQLDTGRKFVSDETTRAAIDKVTQRVVNYFKNYRWAMKIKDRVPIGDDLGTWISSIDGRTGDSFLPALFAALSKTPAAVVDPDNEQEVISLWTALLARDQLPGYEMIAISGFNRYDALMHIREEAVATDGPLGLVSGSTATAVKDHAVLEFKLDFASLIDDLETGVKLAHEMDVVVCWDCPELNLARGTLTPVYGPTWNHGRPARGVSYVWRDDNNGPEIMVIALRVVIAELLNELDPGLGSAALNVLVNRDQQKMV